MKSLISRKTAVFSIFTMVIFVLIAGWLILAQSSANPEGVLYTQELQEPEVNHYITKALSEPDFNDISVAPLNSAAAITYVSKDDETDKDYTGLDYNYEPRFIPVFKREALPEHIIEFISGVTFKENTPFAHSFLAYLTITHVDFEGKDRVGHMIVAEEIADEVLDIFQEIYESAFPIYSIQLIDYFDADDYLSLAANNSSSFNFRYIAGTNVISRHGFGMAIDINPIQNPYIRGNNVLPEAGREYLDRSDIRPGMIVNGDAVYQAFKSRGWTWGGDWTLPIDYHHFERR